jgi:hypothetical protein
VGHEGARQSYKSYFFVLVSTMDTILEVDPYDPFSIARANDVNLARTLWPHTMANTDPAFGTVVHVAAFYGRLEFLRALNEHVRYS